MCTYTCVCIYICMLYTHYVIYNLYIILPIHVCVLYVHSMHIIYMCTYRYVCVGNRFTFCIVDVFCKVAMNLNWQILNHCSKGNIVIVVLFVYLFNPHLRAFFSLHLEREKGREEGKERNITERETLIGCPHTPGLGIREWTCNPGICPNWESNPQPWLPGQLSIQLSLSSPGQ